EALSMADTLAIMIDGRIVQYGRPQDVYDRPATVHVARFFGSPPMNVLEGDMHLLGIRPEHVHPDPNAALRGTVLSVQSTGADRFARASTMRGDVVLRLPSGAPDAALGEEIGIAFDAAHVRHYDRSTGEVLT
ncbi:MAG TPA: TOBE domain-containing protein, partial [Candidatus Baltobacteraceae bacterium]